MAITRQGKTVEQLIEQQTFYFHSYRRVWNKYQGSIASTTSVRYAQGKKVSLENLWSLFQANHRQIMDNPEPSSPAVQGYIQGGLYEELEDIVAQSLAQIEDYIDPLVIAKSEASSKVDDENESNISEDEMQTQRQNQTKVKLPEIKLPHFSGEPKHWVGFKDLFLALVHHNSRLSDIERLQYLRVSLKGEAEDFIKRFALSDANYKPAWEQLTARYDNVTALIDANLKTLFSIPKFKEDKSINIRELLDVPSQAIEAIRQLGFPLGDLDPVLVFIIKDRMPLETRRLWEQQAHSPTSYATWTELQVFLETRFRSLNALEPDSGKSIKYNDSGAWAAKTKRTHFMRTKGDACACCGGQHSLYQCEQFLTLSQPERFKIIKEHHLCINCLARDHAVNNCTSNKVCRTCSKRHHTLLHRKETPKSDSRNTSSPHSDREEEIAVSTQVDGNKSRAVSCLAQAPPVKTILLATARVTLVNSMGQTYVCRALLDQGSQASIISERAAQLLQLRRERSSTEIVGIGNAPPSKTRGMVRFVMQVNSPTEELQIEAYVLKKLTNWLPTETIPLAICDGLQGIQLADPNFGIPGRIDVILGADIFGKLLLSGVRTNLPGNLRAQQTKLGWILSGSLTDTGTSGPSKGNAHSNATIVLANCLTLTDVVQRFWELENVPLETAETEEDRYCEEYYVKTTKRLEDGRYEVSLPWKSNKEDLGLGRSTAINRYLHLERRFAREPALKLKYQECLEDYVQQEHLEKVDLQEIHASAASYLPHHGVTKRDDPSGRIRVVFDASQRTESGLSLNDVLHTGPALQNDIRQIITRWRVHKMVFTTDIKNMYRQISITKPDREYQRIVWKRDEASEAQDWRLTRVTFGVSAAPYLALRTLRQLVEDAGHDFPLASSIIRKDTYVDDIMSGADDLDGAELRDKELNQSLESGKFQLHKWTTNDPTVLQTIDKANKESTSAHSIGTSTITNTLGLRWDSASDYFFYRSSMSDTEMDVVTKRRILSGVSQIYDPLGWIAPIVIVGKILLQELWLRNVGWDASLPEDLIVRWSKFREGLKTLETIRIPRWFGTLSSEEITLVGFCDASQDAYGAVVYVHQGNLDYNGRTTLLVAKSKVAPLKASSIPRLELCAAVLLTRLLIYTKATFDVATILGAWTDSTIVLAWIQQPSRSWKTFVANRVGEIHEAVGSSIWHHIRTEENPADCLSRGTTVDQLAGNTLWWKGPKWLELPYSEWPDKTHVPPTELEGRNPPSHALTVLEQPGFETKYSSLSRLLRITAYCRRFINSTRFGFLPPGTNKELISDELHEAMTTWIKVYQERAFHLELRALRDDHALPRRSPLSSLQPFLDDHEIIRVGGRPKHSSMSFERKHPIVLPAGNHFVDLIIYEAHCNTLHGGPTLVLATLRRRFWILHARRLVKSCISRCIVCTRYSRSATEQQIGDLPAPRVNVSRPFAHVGVDFCGPFLIKRTKRSQQCHKAWVAIFICLAVKAIHLECAGDLSTPTFLAALRRFFARRGLCTDIYSDRGTNFVGAEKILSKLLVQPVVHQELAHQGITWHFMPPAAPHFGGLWEAGVKSFKRHFYRVVGQAKLTIEEFITICAQFEACLNSRPLCPLSDSPDDATALTPGHFLIGDALLSHPDPSINKVQLQHPTRWQHQQRLTQHWWKRWSSEYLNRLQQRPKWLHERPNLQEGDLVLIKEDNLPPARWKMGRIVSTHPGTDVLVRVVTIRVGNSQLLRPITRICRLPINAPPS